MIVNRIHTWAATQPTKPAVICNGAILTYAEFSRAITVVRGLLEVHAPPPGRMALVLVDDLLDAWVLVLALRSLGLTTVAVQSLAQARDLGLRDAAWVVVTADEKARHALEGEVPAGASLVTCPRAMDAARSGEPPDAKVGTRPFGDHILYTSGTTGNYKKVVEAGRLEDARNQARSSAQGIVAGVVYQAFSLGLWTTVGFKSPSAVWHVGGTAVLETRADGFARFFDQGVNRAFCLPSMLASVLDAHAAAGGGRRDVEIIVSGGFLPVDLAARAFREVTDKVRVVYGSTELHAEALGRWFETPEEFQWLVPLDGRTVEIVAEDGRLCDIGEDGELRVRRAEVDAAAYLDDPETSARVFRDSCFYPGDLAVRRADGCVRVLGRTADVLNAGGQKIAAAPIEQEIQRRLGAREVCLFGGLNADGLDELVIAVEADRTPDAAALKEIARSFSMFPTVRFAILTAFPRTQGGMRKTRRQELRRMVWVAAKLA
jgi:acyl-coenzyme A synthetase/AMP-(fatty) acid ligase